MEKYELKVCRLCNKEGFIFCDIYHEAINKIVKLIPDLLNINDENLQHITKVCTSCYQTIKTITYNVERIMDTQKILSIEKAIRPKAHKEQFQIEDITRKYRNIKVEKVSLNNYSPKAGNEKPASKIVVIEAIPSSPPAASPVKMSPQKPPQLESPKNAGESPKKSRCLMCISCSEKFTDFEKLQAHLKSCKSSSSNDLKCFCGKVMNSRKNLELHVYTHHKNNKRKHICMICQKVFSSLFNLQNHSVAAHKSTSRDKCEKVLSEM